MKKFDELSQRCQTVLILMKNNEWITYAWLADKSGMEYHQINSTMELLRKHGYTFDSIKQGRAVTKYRLSKEVQREEVKEVVGRNAGVNLERMTIEMNRVRLLAESKKDHEIARLARHALMACGVLTEEYLQEI